MGKIGAVIKDRRERRLEKRPAVAERAGISADFLKDIERGRYRASRVTYLAVAAALEMSDDEMDELTGQEANVG